MATAKKRPKPKRATVPTTSRRTRKPSAPKAPRAPRASRAPRAPRAQAIPEPLPPIADAPETPTLAFEPEPAPAIESAPDPDLQLATPEVVFAERVAPAEPERPYPASRRAIFFDVENTSRAQHIARVIEHLQINRQGHRTEFYAVGNWRVIGHDTARLLARHGADLVHSAPSVGVRDWSDLRIAVAAGAWLASARPGDVIEIVSDDRAFDAVGDVAASLGIVFHRLSYRALAGAPVEEPPPPARTERDVESRPASDRRGHRYRGRFRGRHDGRSAPPPQPPPAVAPPPPSPARHVEPVASVAAEEEPHTAPHDEIIHVVRDLVRANPGRTVSIDTVANALKSRGFSRPPGSPRLITRLRRLKEIELSRTGMITLVDSARAPDVAAASPEEAAPPSPEPAPRAPVPRAPAPVVAEIVDVDEEDEGPQPGNRKPDPVVVDEDDGPQPGNSRSGSEARLKPAEDDASRRRRRRGGRRRYGRGRPQQTAAP